MKKIFPFLLVAVIPVGAALFLAADSAQQKKLPAEASISISQEHAFSEVGAHAAAKAKPAKSGDGRVRIDRTAPPVAFIALDGSEQTLARRGALSLAMLVDTTCPCVRAYDGRMKQMAKDFPELKIVYIFSSPLESKAQVEKFADARGYKWPVVHDANQKLFKVLGGKCTTESFLFDASGTLRYHGRIDDNIYDESNVKSRDLELAVRAVVAGKPVVKTETSAFGCVIPSAAKPKNTHKGHST